jgi:hypothetical protein
VGRRVPFDSSSEASERTECLRRETSDAGTSSGANRISNRRAISAPQAGHSSAESGQSRAEEIRRSQSLANTRPRATALRFHCRRECREFLRPFGGSSMIPARRASDRAEAEESRTPGGAEEIENRENVLAGKKPVPRAPTRVGSPGRESKTRGGFRPILEIRNAEPGQFSREGRRLRRSTPGRSHPFDAAGSLRRQPQIFTGDLGPLRRGARGRDESNAPSPRLGFAASTAEATMEAGERGFRRIDGLRGSKDLPPATPRRVGRTRRIARGPGDERPDGPASRGRFEERFRTPVASVETVQGDRIGGGRVGSGRATEDSPGRLVSADPRSTAS